MSADKAMRSAADDLGNTKPFIRDRWKERVPERAAAYVALYPLLVRVSRKHGYALAVHGTAARDLDVVAVPWIEEASDALTLIKALKEATGTVSIDEEVDHLAPECCPYGKPHGRVSYVLHCSNKGLFEAYIDIAVMPRIPKQPQQP